MGWGSWNTCPVDKGAGGGGLLYYKDAPFASSSGRCKLAFLRCSKCELLVAGVSLEFPAVLCPLPSPATRAVVWFNSFQVSEYWSELFQFHRPQFGAIEGRLGCLWTISGWGDNRELRVGPQDWLVQVYAWDWTGEGLGRNSVLGLARTHKTISYPLRQTCHVPPPPKFFPAPACWSYSSFLELLVWLSRSNWKHQASGVAKSPHLT